MVNSLQEVAPYSAVAIAGYRDTNVALVGAQLYQHCCVISGVGLLFHTPMPCAKASARFRVVPVIVSLVVPDVAHHVSLSNLAM